VTQRSWSLDLHRQAERAAEGRRQVAFAAAKAQFEVDRNNPAYVAAIKAAEVACKEAVAASAQAHGMPVID
jgi:hypothetical protein